MSAARRGRPPLGIVHPHGRNEPRTSTVDRITRSSDFAASTFGASVAHAADDANDASSASSADENAGPSLIVPPGWSANSVKEGTDDTIGFPSQGGSFTKRKPPRLGFGAG